MLVRANIYTYEEIYVYHIQFPYKNENNEFLFNTKNIYGPIHHGAELNLRT